MPLIVYKYCNCKEFVVYLSIILFLKITIDAELMWRQPLRWTSQWLHLSEICCRLPLIEKNIIGEVNNIFLLLIKIV